MTDGSVAPIAQQTADHAAAMVVVDGQQLGRFPADGARASLLAFDPAVLILREP